MQPPTPARPGPVAVAVLLLTAALAVLALALQIPISAADTDGDFDTPTARVANLFTLFTVLTSLVVAASSLQVALRPQWRSLFWRVLRLDAVIGIIVVAAVYHALLAALNDPQGTELVVDVLWHTVVPVLTVLGWLAFGPRHGVDARVVAWSVAFPLAWLAFTLVRGALTGWYPYPFVDVDDLGYAQVALNCLGITALFLGLAALVGLVDRALGRRSSRGGARIGA